MNSPEDDLAEEQITHLAQRIDARKDLLLGEIRQVLARSSQKPYAGLICGAGDSGDVPASSLLRDITSCFRS